MGVIIVIIILVLLMILVLKNYQKVYTQHDIMSRYKGQFTWWKKGQKNRARSPTPMLNKILSSIKTKEVLGNRSPISKRFPETQDILRVEGNLEGQ